MGGMRGDLWFRVEGLGFRVYGLRFTIYGLGFRHYLVYGERGGIGARQLITRFFAWTYEEEDTCHMRRIHVI
jgi:hypothetical protein